jgi:hypothetical protein
MPRGLIEFLHFRSNITEEWLLWNPDIRKIKLWFYLEKASKAGTALRVATYYKKRIAGNIFVNKLRTLRT